MKRIELFEFEDFNWFPKVIRMGMTNLIIVFHRLVGTEDVLVSLIRNIHQKVSFSQITDLGSGSGGPMPGVLIKLNLLQDKTEPGQRFNLLLTDLHPNQDIVKGINKRNIDQLHYKESSVDATQIDTAPEGLKTMIASFHHMTPEGARSILSTAQQSAQPILIYELAKNNVPFLLWCLLLPLSLTILVVMSLVMTPFVRKLTVSQILFTYLIPIIPLAYAWDGQASLMRTYTFEDIDELLKGVPPSSQYQWDMGDATKPNGKKAGYFLMGYPKEE